MNTIILITAIGSIIIALFLSVCACAVAYLIANAPEGYEDEDGFHYGQRQ